MDNQALHDVITARLKPLGYIVRQSSSSSRCWYASKSERNYLFALIREDQKWRINDITGVGALEIPRISRALEEPCK